MEAFKKIPSSFDVLARKPGLGGKLPPPTHTHTLATRGLMDHRIENLQYGLHLTVCAMGKDVRTPGVTPTEVYPASHHTHERSTHSVTQPRAAAWLSR